MPPASMPFMSLVRAPSAPPAWVPLTPYTCAAFSNTPPRPPSQATPRASRPLVASISSLEPAGTLTNPAEALLSRASAVPSSPAPAALLATAPPRPSVPPAVPSPPRAAPSRLSRPPLPKKTSSECSSSMPSSPGASQGSVTSPSVPARGCMAPRARSMTGTRSDTKPQRKGQVGFLGWRPDRSAIVLGIDVSATQWPAARTAPSMS